MTDGATHQIQVDMGAVAPTGKLREAIGIGSLGGAFTPLLSKGTRLPCAWSGTFSTAEDGQSQLFVHLFRGNTKRADQAVSLGRFKITGIPPMPRGVPQVLVSVDVRQSGIALSVSDKLGISALALEAVAT